MEKVNEPTAVVAVSAGQLLRPIATPSQLIERHKEITVLIRDSLEKDLDYGSIPGTDGKKVLLKPGAERLCVAFGCHPEYKIIHTDTDHDRQNKYMKFGKENRSVGLYRFVVLCELVKDGKMVGTGVGSCSTMESKYINRPRDLENTVLKMAQKRALVAAVLNTFALSDRFTQDVEEFDEKDKETPEAVVVPADTAPVLYNGGDEQQAKVSAILKKQNIPENLWSEVHNRFLNRPSKDLPIIIKEVMQL